MTASVEGAFWCLRALFRSRRRFDTHHSVGQLLGETTTVQTCLAVTLLVRLVGTARYESHETGHTIFFKQDVRNKIVLTTAE